MSVTEQLLSNNEQYAQSFRYARLAAAPGKKLAVLACMDARIDVHEILGLKAGDAHVIRNAGGVVTDDAIRSLVISQRLLGTEHIILIHHTGCGMLTFKDDELKAEIERETGQRPAFAFEAFSDLEANLRRALELIRANPFIRPETSIHGFVYEVESGRLRQY